MLTIMSTVADAQRNVLVKHSYSWLQRMKAQGRVLGSLSKASSNQPKAATDAYGAGKSA